MFLGCISSALNNIGIETGLRNDILGGATGKIGPSEAWIELWVVNEYQTEAATLRNKELGDQSEKYYWFCNYCREANPTTFVVCWQCEEPV